MPISQPVDTFEVIPMHIFNRKFLGGLIAAPMLALVTLTSAVQASPGNPSFAGIWVRSNGPAWQARSGLTSSQYQTLFNQSVSQGYRPIDVSGYTENGQARYAAIFEQSSGPAWVARHGQTVAQFQATFDQLASQGYRLTKISGYNVNGQDLYAGIWTKTGGPAWQARNGVNSAQFQGVFDQLAGQGYRLVDISAY
jgi:hypothetical protein